MNSTTITEELAFKILRAPNTLTYGEIAEMYNVPRCIVGRIKTHGIIKSKRMTFISEKDFNNIVFRMEKGVTSSRLGYDLTKEQFNHLVYTASKWIPAYGWEWFLGFLHDWAYSVDYEKFNSASKRNRLVRKGYYILERDGKVVLINVQSDYAKVFSSINEAHKDIFNY